MTTAGHEQPHKLGIIQSRRARFALVLVGSVIAGGLAGVLGARWTIILLAVWTGGLKVFTAYMLLELRSLDCAALAKRAADLDTTGAALVPASWIAAFLSLLACVIEMPRATLGLPPLLFGFHIFLVAISLGVAWLFVQVAFATRYAHLYYVHGDLKTSPALIFPEGGAPDGADFLHFAIVIGAAAQTADISIAAKSIRRLVTAHVCVAYVFNACVLALAINLGASLV